MYIWNKSMCKMLIATEQFPDSSLTFCLESNCLLFLSVSTFDVLSYPLDPQTGIVNDKAIIEDDADISNEIHVNTLLSRLTLISILHVLSG